MARGGGHAVPNPSQARRESQGERSPRGLPPSPRACAPGDRCQQGRGWWRARMPRGMHGLSKLGVVCPAVRLLPFCQTLLAYPCALPLSLPLPSRCCSSALPSRPFLRPLVPSFSALRPRPMSQRRFLRLLFCQGPASPHTPIPRGHTITFDRKGSMVEGDALWGSTCRGFRSAPPQAPSAPGFRGLATGAA